MEKLLYALAGVMKRVQNSSLDILLYLIVSDFPTCLVLNVLNVTALILSELYINCADTLLSSPPGMCLLVETPYSVSVIP